MHKFIIVWFIWILTDLFSIKMDRLSKESPSINMTGVVLKLEIRF